MNRVELKASFGIDDAGMISGTAWPFGTPDRVGDMIEKGAFAGASLPIPMLFAHDPAEPIGIWESATETEAGLEVRGRLLVDTVERAREIRSLVQAGAVTGLSIGFMTRKAAPRKGGGRNISDLNLVEISLVTIPAHPGARITASKDATAAIRIAEAITRAAVALRT
ncbi:prohead peptidase. Unknown type peptidase. MEROPS family U35 [Kaistia soli DSM 19436]|uniref:Prohead serine protease domain-containing protein n=1 Tax=Kaistia soli DSM 19436 TaxID=1122133 RepID=A0A1M5PR43_9HYPH|nr:HK97 family phage prohead protease [Kaistia soli]SHH04009.1 prohead peptidase. Unknown type peptidase. MEROPS family U35 [Kaistia soli DSM 19436]